MDLNHVLLTRPDRPEPRLRGDGPVFDVMQPCARE